MEHYNLSSNLVSGPVKMITCGMAIIHIVDSLIALERKIIM